jgi:hypothetical protein
MGIFLQGDAVNREKLQEVLHRHNLSQKWADNAYRFEV